MRRRGIAILGSTGSIGTTALRVLSRHTDRFSVSALTAFENAALLQEQADIFKPSFVGVVRNGSAHPANWREGEGSMRSSALRASRPRSPRSPRGSVSRSRTRRRSSSPASS